MKSITGSNRSSRRANVLAFIASAATVSVLYAGFDTTEVGSDPEELVLASITIPDAVKVDLSSLTPPSRPEVDESEPVRTASVDTDTDPDASSCDVVESEPTPEPVATDSSETNRLTLLITKLMLDRGIAFMSSIPDYTVTFHRHERVKGEMLDPQVMKMKMRHEPFSVYMKWSVGDKGRQLLYVPTENDGNLVVKLGGLKGRLIPALNLDPEGDTAMAESRHSILKVGIRGMAQELVRYRNEELTRPDTVVCRMLDDVVFTERDCHCFIVIQKEQALNPDYRKTIMFLDKELSIPLMVRNHGWAVDADDLNEEELDDLTLIENYAFTDLDLECDLAAADFDATNKRYRMRR